MPNVAEIVIRAFDQSKPAFASANKSLKDLAQVAADARTALAGAASGFGAGLLVREIVSASATSERFSNALKTVFGTSQAAAQEIGFLKDQSRRLGLDLESTTKAYVSLSAAANGTSLEGEKVREIFLGVSEASTVLGLSAEQTEGALQAIQQMISKGTVQAEELRGQLGERLPGAFQIASKAMGVTTQELGKMLEQGQVISSDFLPKLAQELRNTFSESAVKSSGSLTAEFNRLKAAMFELKVAAGDAGVTGAVKKLVISATQFASSLAKSESAMLAMASATKVAGTALIALAGQMALVRVWSASVALFGAQWLKTAADVRAAAVLMATSTVTASASMVASLAGITAATWAVVEGYRAIKAESNLKESTEALAQQNDKLRQTIEAGLEMKVKAGSLSESDAAKLKSEIAAAFTPKKFSLSDAKLPLHNFPSGGQVLNRDTAAEHSKLMEISRQHLIPRAPDGSLASGGDLFSAGEADKAASVFAKIRSEYQEATNTKLQLLFLERRQTDELLKQMRGDEEETAIARLQLFATYDRKIEDEKQKIHQEEIKRIAQISELARRMRMERLSGAALEMAQADSEHSQRLDQIRELLASEEEKRALIEEAEVGRKARLLEIDAEYYEKVQQLRNSVHLATLNEFDQQRAAAEEQLAQRYNQIGQLSLTEEQALELMKQAHGAYAREVSQVRKQEDAARFESISNYASHTAAAFGNLASVAQAFGKKGWKAFKAFASAEAVASALAGATRAYKDVPWPLNIVVSASILAAGMANVARINSTEPVGVAHGGLDFVPREGTFLLQRGERVIQPRQNEQLTEFLESRRPESGRMVSVNIYLDRDVLAKGIGEMSRDGVLEIHAKSIV